MKKIARRSLSLVLAICMVLSLAATSLAATGLAAGDGNGGILDAISTGTDGADGEKLSGLSDAADFVSESVISADDAIIGVSSIGFVDNDGAKVSAIIIEYSTDLPNTAISLDKYEVINRGILSETSVALGGDAGKPLDIYVNTEPAVSPEHGTEMGKYVIIEVNTDYQRASMFSTYRQALAVGVFQESDIVTDDLTIEASGTYFNNYGADELGTSVGNAIDDTYILENIAEYELFKIGDGAFLATDCWEESTGQYVDVELPYALYVPSDYDPSLEYALVVQIPSAGGLGDDPMIALNNDQGPANFASEDVQDLVKPELGGIIVLVPQIPSALRATRDDGSLSAAVPAIWQLVDELTEDYNIDMNRIYGEGESMGGMTLLAMAAQRDNYFAGIWANGCQWWSNFNLEDPTYNSGTPYAAAPADGDIIWTVDSDGNPVDHRNMYYMLSDDNILITNCVGDNFSSGAWREFWFLYYDLAGVEIPRIQFAPLDPDFTKEAQSDAVREMIASADSSYDRGIFWYSLDGGNHNATWLYSHAIFASYEWLLSQTRESEMNRDKLDINKPFVEADTAGAAIVNGISRTGSGNEALLTGESGSGTLGYNSALFGNGGNGLRREHAWTADMYAASVGYVYYTTIQEAVDAVKNSSSNSTINILRTDKDVQNIVVDGSGTGTITIRDTRLPESFFLDNYGSSENRIYKTTFAVDIDIQRDNVLLSGTEFDEELDDQTVTFTLYPKRATLVVTDVEGTVMTSRADGSYLLAPGDYTYTVTKYNYDTVTMDFTVKDQGLSFVITLDADVDLSIFTDLDLDPNTWYLGHVEYSVANTLFIGIGDNQWGPSADLTRSMFVTALGKFEGADITEYPTSTFADVEDGTFYTSYVQWAFEEGLVAGVGGNRFEPDRAITRQEIAQIFMAYADYCGVDVTDPGEAAFEEFLDKDETSEWAIPAMIWVTANEIMVGDGANNVKPLDNTSRAEAAAIFRAVIEDIIP